MGYLILDTVRKSLVEEMPECTISVTMDLTSYAVEFYHIFVHTLTVCHRQVAELMFCITDGVMRTEVHLEFQNKLGVIIHPKRTEHGGFGEEEVRFNSRAISLRYDWAKMTLAQSVWKALGRSWKQSLHWIKKVRSLWGSKPLNWSGMRTLVL